MCCKQKRQQRQQAAAAAAYGAYTRALRNSSPPPQYTGVIRQGETIPAEAPPAYQDNEKEETIEAVVNEWLDEKNSRANATEKHPSFGSGESAPYYESGRKGGFMNWLAQRRAAREQVSVSYAGRRN